MLVETERLRIVDFAPRHLTERHISWLNDPEVVRFSEQRHRVHTLESCTAYLESFKGSPSLFLALELREPSNRHVGNMTVAIDPPNGLADISIMIGDRTMWGRGLGLEAWRAMIAHLHGRRRIRKVTGGTVAVNSAMVAIMRDSGMVEDGVRRGHHVIGGQSVDVFYYSSTCHS